MVPDVNFGLSKELLDQPTRFYGYEQIKKKVELETVTARPVTLETHAQGRMDLSSEWRELVETYKDLPANYKNEKIDLDYVDSQIDLFLSTDSELTSEVKNGNLETFFNLALSMVKKGTSDPDPKSDFASVQAAFSLEDPRSTKCVNFNRLFKIFL